MKVQFIGTIIEFDGLPVAERSPNCSERYWDMFKRACESLGGETVQEAYQRGFDAGVEKSYGDDEGYQV